VVIPVLFGIVFGYLEAATVVYIRLVYEPIHQRLFPEREADDLFPLFSFEQWAREGPACLQTPALEVGRELGTVAAVALVALAVGQSYRQWAASFFLALGVWVWSYYGWLKVMVGWPHSLSDWDLIFAAPLPWVGPVGAALTVGATMVVTSGCFVWKEVAGQPLKAGRWGWLALGGGSLTLTGAFWWDYRNVLASQYPQPFNWILLVAGLSLVLLGMVMAWLRSTNAEPEPTATAAARPASFHEDDGLSVGRSS
jgi:hypothetical protein